MGLGSVPVGIGPPNQLLIPLNSMVDEGELDLTTVTGLVLTVAVPNGPFGSYLTNFTWTASIASGPIGPFPGPSKTAAVGVYNFVGTEFIIAGLDVVGQYRLRGTFTTAGGPVPSKEWQTLEVTSRTAG